MLLVTAAVKICDLRVLPAGQWSIDMFAMFRLGRPNVLPVGDLGVRRGMENLYRLKVCIQNEPFLMHQGKRPFKQKL